MFTDYWVNFLWKRTLGASVYNASSSDGKVRAYAFGGAPPSPFAAPECAALAVLLLNLHNASVVAGLPTAGGFAAWSLAPQDGVFGGTATLNSAALATTIDVARVDPNTFLGSITVPPVRGKNADGVTLPPASVTFVCLGQ